MSDKKMHISESSHWYRSDGTPAYEVDNGKGKMVKTTLAWAKKLNLFESVTTITGQLSKPFVDNWRIEMYLKTAFNCVPSSFADYEDYRATIMELVEPKLNEGALAGTAIHDALEKHLKGEEYDRNYQNVIDNVNVCLKRMLPPNYKGTCEMTFCHKDRGYAGKMDLLAEVDDEFVLSDFKTTSARNYASLCKAPYPEYAMQLSAYGNALPKKPRAYYNIIINRDTGEAQEYQWSAMDIEKGWLKFDHLLEYWKIANNYYPEVEKGAMPF